MKFTVFDEIDTWKRPYHLLLDRIAAFYLKNLPSTDVIGITGSVGKTLTQNAIYAVVSQKFRTVVGDENLDPTFRIPKTILKAKPWDQILILEYGVQRAHDMDYYLKIAKPNIAVITLIAPTHTKYFKNTQGVFDEKIKLIKNLPRQATTILNASDAFSKKAKKLTYSKTILVGPQAKDGVKISHFKQNLKGSKFRIHYQSENATVSWKIIGKHQLLSAYIAATVGIIKNLTLKQIASGLSKTKPPVHRLNPIKSKNYIILDDSYNSSPRAASESISTLIDIGKRKKKVLVLGEMKDLGDLDKIAHENLGKKIAKTKINYLVTIGKAASQITKSAKKSGFKGKIFQVANVAKTIKTVKKFDLKNAIILVKGSRHAHLERVIFALLGKPTKINCYHCGSLD